MLIRRRYPHLGEVNAERIADFSGGNARLALALADRVEDGEGLSAFSNLQLFERLFWQRGALDRNLLEAAQVLSLVYSFSVSENQDGVDHLCVLAGLIERNRLTKRAHIRAHTLPDPGRKTQAAYLGGLPRDKSGRNRAARNAIKREPAFFCKHLKVFYRTGGCGGLR